MKKLEFNLYNPNESTIASIGGTGFGNTSAYKLNNYLMIIDTSMYTRSAQQFKTHVEEKFSVPVSHVVYTHYHGDHTFGSAPFKNATVISSKDTLLNLQKDYSDDWKKGLEDEDPLVSEPIEVLQPDKTFDNSYKLSDDGFEVEIRRLGGHTSGSSIMYSPKDKVMFGGDLIFNLTFPYGGDPTCDLDEWIEAIKSIKSYNTSKIIPGHGPIIENKNELDPHIRFFTHVKSVLLEGIESQKSPEQIESGIEIPDVFHDAAERRKDVSFENWYEIYKSKYAIES